MKFKFKQYESNFFVLKQMHLSAFVKRNIEIGFLKMNINETIEKAIQTKMILTHQSFYHQKCAI